MKIRPIDRALGWAKEEGMNQSDLARRLGVLPQDVTNWKKRDLPSDKYLDVATALNRSIDDLLGRSGYKRLDAHDPAHHGRLAHIRLPVLDVSPAAGPGGEPSDYPAVIDYMEVPEAWASHKLGRDLSKYRLLPVSGDSMSPTINDGDLAFVDTRVQSFDSEGIYVIVWNDRLLIKRLRAVLATQRIEIRSDNTSAYGVETVSMEELSRLHICGLVRCWWSIKGA